MCRIAFVAAPNIAPPFGHAQRAGMRNRGYLLALVGRAALLEEGSHALLLILAREQELEALALEHERGLERCVLARQQHLLDLAHGERRQVGDLLGEGYGPVEDLVVGHELADETHGFGLARRDGIA